MTATIDRGAATKQVAPHAAQTSPPTRRRPGLFASSNGKKAVMAVTGAILVLFLVGHMVGNLKSFFGADSFNHYAEWLRTVGSPAVPNRVLLTVVEIALVLAVALHMWSAVSLARRASKARPVKYAAKRKSQANGYATHTMRYGGVIIVLFVVWHLLDMTFGTVNPEGFDAEPYDRLVAGFDPSRWWVTLFYVVAMIMVGLHLRHGLWSAFQTLGLASGRSYGKLKAAAALVSLVLVVGFLAVPVGVMIGVIK
ncbi:succinate dehydrogenase cytochrome b subunit [Microtetraspora sp. AC03309]|uniref:succinate dehydrogenase cytochrome b subunit n=1 Tax=Microtetraspora sp. AC03309 TaxID=2779376 RepID=UPI001E3E46DA|nr:succinate dehydrogenase cytochrome b subunit [Microtetraspora sp. AC03309]MCC5574357.1 succinate dehydrogenase cytochrome b subunit [Microtetraspora sp. AC03309]